MRYQSSSSNRFSKQLRNAAAALGALLAPAAVHAQEALNKLRDVGVKTGFAGNDDPREVVATIIQGALGLLGVVFLVLVVYGGFLWMTGGGDEEKIKNAQATIRRAVIGLLIVLCAYAISVFVVNSLLNATQ